YTTTAGLLPGTYFVLSGNNLGYINTLYNGIGCFNCPATSGTPVTVTGTGTTSGINLALTAGGALSGHVQTTSGVGLSNVSVFAYTPTGSFGGSSFTNALGNYTLAGLPTGMYVVRTSNSLGYIDGLYTGGASTPCLGC